MKDFLHKIRQPVVIKTSKAVFSALIILLVGISLGIVAKALDETPSNVLPAFLESLDLSNFFSRMAFWLWSGICIAVYSRSPLRAALNVFLFFMGMVCSYYIYTIEIAGFFPKSYMMIWFTMTGLSPFFAIICWYARGTHPLSIGISSVIFMLMARQAFSFGYWYFEITYVLELILLLTAIGILYKTPRQILLVIALGTLLFFTLSQFSLLFGML